MLILAVLVGVLAAIEPTMKLVGKIEVYTREYRTVETQVLPDSLEYTTSLGERVVFIPKNEAVDSILSDWIE